MLMRFAARLPFIHTFADVCIIPDLQSFSKSTAVAVRACLIQLYPVFWPVGFRQRLYLLCETYNEFTSPFDAHQREPSPDFCSCRLRRKIRCTCGSATTRSLCHYRQSNQAGCDQ